jgi:chaperonin GroEL
MSEFKVGKEARDALSESLDKVAQAIGSTLGPGGRPFGYKKFTGYGYDKVASFSKDGLTVLKALRPSTPSDAAVVEYCNQASAHSVLESGDGTSSTIILANAVCKAVLRADNKYPQAFARRLEKDAQNAIKAIRNEAIIGDEAVRKVALTSTNGDEELTNVVLEAIDSSSTMGTILVNKNAAQKQRYKIERQEGYSNCKGYEYNQIFALSADSETASSKPIEWENPSVVIYNGDLIIQTQIEPILEAWKVLVQEGKSAKLVIVAYQISEEIANRLMVLNRKFAQQGLAVFVVQPRLSAEINAGLHITRDIAAFCGIDDQKIVDGGNVKFLDNSYFGTCGKVRISREGTAFLGRASNHWVEKRIFQNKAIWEEARSDFDRELPKIRNAELAEGLVTVVIGGGLLPDLHERADRFDDAAKAAKACKVSGALPGAGCSYIRAGNLAEVHPELKEAFREVNKRILQNYGTDHDEALAPEEGMTTAITEDSISYIKAYDAGILDACETVCSVIKNGVDLGIRIATVGGYFFPDQNEK